MLRAIGLMSGTSLDGVDAAWLTTDGERIGEFGPVATGGSSSIRAFSERLRDAGAGARVLLAREAADRWGVAWQECEAAEGFVTHGGKRLRFAELAERAAGRDLPEPVPRRAPGTGALAGRSLPRLDVPAKLDGSATFASDVRLPGMKYVAIARPPVVGGKLVSFDAAEASQVPGVERVMTVRGWPWPSKFQPLGGVAVIARNTGAAIKGRDALKIVWEDGANGRYDSAAYRAELEAAARKPGLVVRNTGDADAALQGADRVVTGEYYLPHLAHVSMEPPVATAQFTGSKLELWAPVQSPWRKRTTSPS